MAERIDNPALDVTAEDVLVLRNAGPKGAPGMPEAGYIPIPKKLARAGVKDMLRISDARMSGTAFGAIVLHLCPEAAVGGPLALVQNGDRIRLDVENRTLNVLISDEELAARRAAWTPPPPHAGAERGWLALHLAHVQQADKGCDLDILSVAPTGARAPV
jgi:dihydroxy-acid dehydratase